MLADLACAIADGARVISDFRVMGDQGELFGLVASVPTAWRTLKEIAAAGPRAEKRIIAAVNTARRHAWAQVVGAARRAAGHQAGGPAPWTASPASGWMPPSSPRIRTRSSRKPTSRGIGHHPAAGGV